jgi:Rrf2 family protein
MRGQPDAAMLTMKGKYGLKAMLHLARLSEGDLALATEIAEANTISKKFLDAILRELRVAGLVQTRKGRSGGYRLARAAASITVGEVLAVLDGPVVSIQCAAPGDGPRCYDCRHDAVCAVRLTMRDVRDAVTSVLDRRSLADVVAATDALAGREAHASVH